MLSLKCACVWQFVVGTLEVSRCCLQGGECSAGILWNFHSCTLKSPSQPWGSFILPLAGLWVKLEESKMQLTVLLRFKCQVLNIVQDCQPTGILLCYMEI